GPHRSRERERSLEAWDAVVDPDRAVGIGRERLLDRIDIEPQPHRAVIAGATGRNAIGILLAAQQERALALEGTSERAQFTLELELFQHRVGVAGGVPEQCAAIDDVEALDR